MADGDEGDLTNEMILEKCKNSSTLEVAVWLHNKHESISSKSIQSSLRRLIVKRAKIKKTTRDKEVLSNFLRSVYVLSTLVETAGPPGSTRVRSLQMELKRLSSPSLHSHVLSSATATLAEDIQTKQEQLQEHETTIQGLEARLSGRDKELKNKCLLQDRCEKKTKELKRLHVSENRYRQKTKLLKQQVAELEVQLRRGEDSDAGSQQQMETETVDEEGSS